MPKSVTGLKLFTISAFALAMLGGLSGCAEKQPTPKAPAVTVRNPFVDEPVAETEEEAKPETKPETQTEIQPEVSPELRPIPAYPTLQPFDTADSITIEIKNQCAVDVCGSLDTAIPAKEIIEGTKRSKKTASLFANIEPTIADWFNLNHVSQVKQFENFKRHKEALKTLQIEPKYLPLHNLFWTFSSMSKLLVDYNGTNIEDDKFEKALKENFPGENAAVVKAMLEHVLYAKDIASSSMVERIGFYELTRAHLASIFEPVKAIVVSKGVLNPSDEEVHAYYQLYAANELLQSVQRLAKEFPSLPIKPTDGLVKLSQGKDVTSAESSAVSRDYTFSYIYKAAFDSGVFEKRKSDLQATIAIFEKTLAPKLEAKISNSEQVKVNIEKAATTCREVTNKIALLDLTTAHLEAAKPMIEKVRSAALEQASFMRLSPEAQAKLKERITKISYMLPLTSAERLERIRLSLVKDIASTQDS
ncbi:MAG: hypothetical protein V4692_04920, partial [Bdellovibrionota bacterium]